MKTHNLLPTLFVTSLLVNTSASADQRCYAEVSYSWKDEKGTEENVSFEIVQHIAPDEEGARVRMRDLLHRSLKKANAECTMQHKNLTDCISYRFTKNEAILKSLDFSGRKILEDAISDDCKKTQGSCNAAKASEIKCEEVKVPVVEQPEAELKEVKGDKDKEKDKKKKK